MSGRNPAAIRFENVSKRYRIGAGRESLREAIYALPGRLIRRDGRGPNSGQSIWAMNDVSLEIERGTAFGVVGHNGAGKTTLLKLISKVARPTSGQIESNGRISALIELGAGFHPDLTGRENIFLNGVILGLSRKEIRERFESIVQFAELEKYMDTPVKRYSSGMYARLGFAVAAHVDPDILLVDEVLSVGDEAFQLKCYDYIQGLVGDGRTSIFVSHNLKAIEQLCDRVIWVDQGKIIQDGTPNRVLRAYMDDTDRRRTVSAQANATPNGGALRIRELRVLDANGVEKDAFATGEDIIVSLDFEAERRLERPHFCIWISDAHSHLPLISANMLVDDFIVPAIDGSGSLTCRFKQVPLRARAYSVWVEVYGKDRVRILYMWRVLGGFRILSNSDGTNDSEESRGRIFFERAHAPVEVQYEWCL